MIRAKHVIYSSCKFECLHLKLITCKGTAAFHFPISISSERLFLKSHSIVKK